MAIFVKKILTPEDLGSLADEIGAQVFFSPKALSILSCAGSLGRPSVKEPHAARSRSFSPIAESSTSAAPAIAVHSRAARGPVRQGNTGGAFRCAPAHFHCGLIPASRVKLGQNLPSHSEPQARRASAGRMGRFLSADDRDMPPPRRPVKRL